MIKVLVVEDSPVIRDFLVHILDSGPEMQVIGTAGDGEKAIESAVRLKPDVITMDIHMPKMDGLEATKRIMEVMPTPIVIVTGSSAAREVATAFHAMEVGALAVVPRPRGISDPEYETTAKELIQTIRLMSEVKVVRRLPHLIKKLALPTPAAKVEAVPAEIKLVVVGGSTGAPLVLQAIFSHLPKEFPVPVLTVQHIAAGFISGFAEWLNAASALQIRIAIDGEYLLPGHVYLAPDGLHMGVADGNRVMLSKDTPENGLRPSVSYLFRSAAQVFGKNAVGVLLTGMGNDGAEELKLMKDKGAVTIAQDKESSIVHGMPGEAIALGAATYVLPAEEIASALITVVSKR